MIREYATASLDLPHAYVRELAATCSCGRAEHDPLHEVVEVEKASTTTRFETEKGS